jgi:hypothetical protein
VNVPIGVDTSASNRFEGRALITIRVLKSTRFILFHCDSSLRILNTIEITSLATNNVITLKDNQHGYQENQFYKIELDSELNVGDYVMKLDYSGNYGPHSNIYGFYMNRYNEDGVTKCVYFQ